VAKNYIYFARPDALSGSLPETIRFVKPTAFFAVPRVYEKFQDRIKEVLDKTTGLKKRIGNLILKLAKWSMKVGSLTVDKKFEGEQPSVFFKLANYLFFSKVKAALGFENTQVFSFGAAPLKKSTLEFFKSLYIPLFNNYGLSETTGPHFLNFGEKHVDLLSAGVTLPGADSRIINQDKDGVGEICCRGRNRFMGYYKDEKSTSEAIDSEGFLHTGDQGYFNSKGNLIITGRIKELIVTAGGENVAPLPIEEALKDACKCVSNVIVIGDDRKYLSALITLKTEPNGNLSPECLETFGDISIDCKTSIDDMNDSKIKSYIQGIIDNINRKAVSKAQVVKKWMILPHDFSVDGGEFTPTMKLKRKYVAQKYAKEIEKMYSLPKY
jgi:long-chain-fatty-acid--CoA ligase ACSBG